MVWHIFKKDCRVLWHWIVLVAVLQIFAALLSSPGGSHPIVDLISFAALSFVLLLAAKVVQQDALVDIRQDWHVRPIRRGHLLVAKLLFVFVMLHGPLFLMDLGVGVGFGYSVSESAVVAGLRGLTIICVFTLPAVALATLSRSAVGAIAGGWATLLGGFLTVTFLGAFALAIAGTRWKLTVGVEPLSSGLGWIQLYAMAAIVLLAAVAILVLRYFRRSTGSAYCVLATAVVLVAATPFVLWKPALAIQQRLSPRPDLASGISLAFAPGAEQRRWRLGRIGENVTIELPLRFSGLGPDSLLLRDRVTTVLSAPDGTRLYSETISSGGPQFRFSGLYASVGNDSGPRFTLSELDRKTGHRWSMQAINIPADLYDRVKNAPLRVEIEYALTLLEVNATYTLPASSEVFQRVGDLGFCAVPRQFGFPLDIALRCFRLHKPPICIQTGLDRAPEEFGPMRDFTDCTLNYAPVGVRIFPGVMYQSSFMAVVDHPGRARNSSVADRKVTIRTFAPQAHFTRRLVIPEIRLAARETGG